jgi:hypothetical protein
MRVHRRRDLRPLAVVDPAATCACASPRAERDCRLAGVRSDRHIAGHFVASLGARLDELYDALRDKHGNSDLRNHADGVRLRYTRTVRAELANEVRTAIAARKDPKPAHGGFVRFVALLVHSAWRSEAGATEITNAYKLARTTLARTAPALYSEMLRTEADSKFFRSFVIVAVLVLFASLFELGTDIWTIAEAYNWDHATRLLFGAAYFGLVWAVLRLAFARFCELRLKATEMAFHGMIAVAHAPTAHDPKSTKPDDD